MKYSVVIETRASRDIDEASGWIAAAVFRTLVAGIGNMNASYIITKYI